MLLQLIALGRTYLVAPESAQAQLGEGVAAVPLVDASKVTTLTAWPPQSRSHGPGCLCQHSIPTLVIRFSYAGSSLRGGRSVAGSEQRPHNGHGVNSGPPMTSPHVAGVLAS